jgi:hypothetical protein
MRRAARPAPPPQDFFFSRSGEVDVLLRNGEDLRPRPLLERKTALANVNTYAGGEGAILR